MYNSPFYNLVFAENADIYAAIDNCVIYQF